MVNQYTRPRTWPATHAVNRGWIVRSERWGVLVHPRYPALWLPRDEQAHVFRTRREALKEASRWKVKLTIEER